MAGEPGIGKTRLLEELKNLAVVRKIRVLYGRFVEQDRSFSYQGFCELIEDYFQSRDAGSLLRAARLLRPRPGPDRALSPALGDRGAALGA